MMATLTAEIKRRIVSVSWCNGGARPGIDSERNLAGCLTRLLYAAGNEDANICKPRVGEHQP